MRLESSVSGGRLTMRVGVTKARPTFIQYSGSCLQRGDTVQSPMILTPAAAIAPGGGWAAGEEEEEGY